MNEERELYTEQACDAIYEDIMPSFVPNSLRYEIEDAISHIFMDLSEEEIEIAAVECGFTPFDAWLAIKYPPEVAVQQTERLFE